ncbi:hypothetical protein BTVI_43795 [Pitangus sulphuratus]|nr:hypothetical protein BTVI_43795 [Pitangus sulphuratus]
MVSAPGRPSLKVLLPDSHRWAQALSPWLWSWRLARDGGVDQSSKEQGDPKAPQDNGSLCDNRGHSDLIVSLRLPLYNKQHVVLFSIYAPTLQVDPAKKDKFYINLCRLTQKVSTDDKIIILGDFNARVGKNSEAWKRVLGKYGVGNCNDNRLFLLEFCVEHQLTITNTIFQQKDSLKTTWMHTQSKHWHLIDYVLVRQRNVCNVCHTQVMPSAECQTNVQGLVLCKLNFHFKFKPKRGGIPRRRLQVNNLQTTTVRDSFQGNLQTRLKDHPIDPSPKALWQHTKNSILQSSEESLGFSFKKNEDWFDENNQEIQELLIKKRTVHQTLFSTNHVVQGSAIQYITQQPVKNELDIAPTMGEILKAIQQVKTGKAGGVDGIPPEVWKHGGQALHAKFHEEQNKGLYVTFVDLTKDFDTESRKDLWQILERLGCPPKFLKMIILLHEDQCDQVRYGDALSEPFLITNGVKQGCILAPTLFTIFFSMMLQRATEDLDEVNNIYIQYHTNGSLFNLRQLKAHTKTLNHLVRELLYADAAALVTHTEVALQCLTSCFAEAAELFGLEVRLKKTEVLYQPGPQEVSHHPHIIIGESELKSVQHPLLRW